MQRGLRAESPANAPWCHAKRGTEALSTSASQLELAPAWKQEVNKRLAAHVRRRGHSTSQLDSIEVSKQGTSSLAAKAAARVAERYSKAPKYSDLLAGEARAAVRVAEAAGRAASSSELGAQAAAEFVLGGLAAGFDVEEPQELEGFHGGSGRTLEHSWETSAEPAQFADGTVGEQSYKIRWEADLPQRQTEPAAMRATHGTSGTSALETSQENWWESSAKARDAHRFFTDADAVEDVEPAQPLHANLIEFPRELVATRKMRPRLAEGPLAADYAMGQLSIFEVDPGSVSMEPVAPGIVTVAAADWASLDWAGIKLDEHPGLDIELEDDPAPATVAVQPASINLRLMATVVDCSLVAVAFFAAAMVVMDNATDLPTLKQMEPGAVMALLAIMVVYQALFFALGSATPGMRWAHISLRTLNDAMPTRGQRCARLVALLLSLLPVGLGVAWAIFDEGHLTWHDRLSGTYLKKG
jgi:uncharacterized RDD family membrane protein YckC